VPPEGFTRLDWEVELGIVIGSQARNVTADAALSHVAGFCVANDVSERSWQLEKSGGQWGKGKGFDSFGPVGPWLVTPDEVPDPQNLDLWLDVNGERMQTGNSRLMIFSCAEVVARCSQVMTLEPGDLIITGTRRGGHGLQTAALPEGRRCGRAGHQRPRPPAPAGGCGLSVVASTPRRPCRCCRCDFSRGVSRRCRVTLR
jgi:2-keto-4-pentenoate hydratase/2-oxohepta-3-ene-1,7-dioic acid hydratase in catechol pathway